MASVAAARAVQPAVARASTRTRLSRYLRMFPRPHGNASGCVEFAGGLRSGQPVRSRAERVAFLVGENLGWLDQEDLCQAEAAVSDLVLPATVPLLRERGG